MWVLVNLEIWKCENEGMWKCENEEVLGWGMDS